MKFRIVNHFDKEMDEQWESDTAYQGLKDWYSRPMMKAEAETFNDMLELNTFTNIEPGKTFMINY